MLLLVLTVACGRFDYDVPLDPHAPWPKFRRDAAQTGASPVRPTGADPWTVPTGKGIFSTPVIDGDGTTYVGSASRSMLAIDADGAVKWTFETGEIIDSSALLDDAGRLYFGSGDGHLYALDRETGEQLWAFEADDPETNDAFIRWFEGNVAMLPSGDLLVPNDNFCIYSVDRDTGTANWCHRTLDQTWSLPAVDAETGVAYGGNNFLLGTAPNLLAIDGGDGALAWGREVSGTIAASPLLAHGLVVVGSFDGYVRAFDADSGAPRWEFATRDHVYASPGLLPDGGIVQPSADGTVYCLEADGTLRWAYDGLDPIRSSPAIDRDGRIYLGTGGGALLVLEPDGALAWSLQLVTDDRNDLNASPALGRDTVVIAGESGEIFGVPGDWCDEETDARCTLGPGELLPADGSHLLATTPLGTPSLTAPATLDPTAPLVVSLLVREAGDTVLALLDDDLAVTVTPDVPFHVEISGDRRFAAVVPDGAWAFDPSVTVDLTGTVLVDPVRTGLRMEGGTPAGTVTASFTFAPTEIDAALPAFPVTDGDEGTVWAWSRLAAPLPTILPSYNQIGFDSLHNLIVLVEGDGSTGVAMVVGGTLDEGGDIVADPTTRAAFAADVSLHDGAVSLTNTAGFSMNVMNADIAFSTFRIDAVLGPDGGAVGAPHLLAVADCGEIPFYGAFLRQLGFCNPDSDAMVAYGSVLLDPWTSPRTTVPLGTPALTVDDDHVALALTGTSVDPTEHWVGLVLVDADTGRAISRDYGVDTRRVVDGDTLTVSVPAGELPDAFRVHLLVDATRAWSGSVGPR